LESAHIFNRFSSVKAGALLFLSCASLAGYGCGGGGGASPPPPPSSTITSVTVSPAGMSVLPGHMLQFMANVQGTGTFSSSVTWSVNGPTGGNQTLGIIDATGLYTAPSNPPNPNTVTITATSLADATKSGSTKVVVGTTPFHITGISINPTSVSLATAGTQQFSSVVQGTGTFDSSVVWSAAGVLGGNTFSGTISPTGFYTAPDTVSSSTSISIQVASVVDPSVTKSAVVTVTQGPPSITQIVPSSASAGDQIQILGHSFAGSTTIYFPGPGSIQIAVPLGNTAGQSQLQCVVPLSSVSGPVYLQTQPPGGPLLTSNSVAFTRIPHLRIRANRRDLSSGETVQFQYRILGEDLSQTIAWTADIGSITGTGAYTAPANVTTDSFAVVSGCIQATQVCEQFRLGLHPFRVDPAVPIVSGGNSLQLRGIQGLSAVSPAWVLNGPGSISSTGLYTASALVTDGGSAAVSATSGGVAETSSIGVTGAFPGVVNRVNDYMDLKASFSPFGTSVSQVAVSGNRAYALGSVFTSYFSAPSYLWVDVYDLTDPQHPVWVDAIESAEPGNLLACGHFLYELADEATFGGQLGVISTFDVSGPHPILKARNIDAAAVTYINSGCTAATFPGGVSVPANSAAQVDIADLSSGTAIHTPYFLPLAQPSSSQLISATSDGKRLFLFFDTASAGSSQSHLSAYDLTKQPPALLGDLPVVASDFIPRIAGHYLTSVPPIRLGIDRTNAYDLTGAVPALVGALPMGAFLDAGPNRAVFADGQGGLRVLDVSGSGLSIPFSNLFDAVYNLQAAAVSGGLVLSAEGPGGIIVYDVSVAGGPVWEKSFDDSSPLEGFAPRDQLLTPTNLFIAVGQQSGGGLLVRNLQTNPASFAGSFSTGTSVAQGLAISGNTLFLATEDDTRILDVTNTANPAQIGVIGIGTTALAVSGNFLFAGTVDNRIVVFDISNTASPVQKGSISIPDLPIQIRISGMRMFVADSTAGLLIFDISSPSAPALLSSTQPSSNVFGVAVDGNLALLAAWEGGIVIVDCTDPAHPLVKGQAKLDTIDPFKTVTAELLNHAAAITLSNGIAFIGVDNFDPNLNNGNAAIYGFDYRQPSAPRLVSLTASGTILRNGIITIAANGSRLFAGGDIAVFQMDITKPRNTINLFFLPDSLRPPVNLGSPARISAGPFGESSLQLAEPKRVGQVPLAERMRFSHK
jgi:hypothetical protein